MSLFDGLYRWWFGSVNVKMPSSYVKRRAVMVDSWEATAALLGILTRLNVKCFEPPPNNLGMVQLEINAFVHRMRIMRMKGKYDK